MLSLDLYILGLCVILTRDRFNWAARKLYKRLFQLGANEIYPCGEADQRHDEGFVFFIFAFDPLHVHPLMHIV